MNAKITEHGQCQNIDQKRIENLMTAILLEIKSNYEVGPISPYRVFEALNALAGAAALIIKGCHDPRGRAFFEKALKQALQECERPADL
jgi:hypothetical protein